MKPTLTRSSAKNRTVYFAPKQYPTKAIFYRDRELRSSLEFWVVAYLALVLISETLDACIYNRINHWCSVRGLVRPKFSGSPPFKTESRMVVVYRYTVTVEKVWYQSNVSVAFFSIFEIVVEEVWQCTHCRRIDLRVSVR